WRAGARRCSSASPAARRTRSSTSTSRSSAPSSWAGTSRS
ncbi:MAG: hypothetical protein AVDCRST_MAG85-3087, partial [uncultured Solirubrobacteraceae bacterium]